MAQVSLPTLRRASASLFPFGGGRRERWDRGVETERGECFLGVVSFAMPGFVIAYKDMAVDAEGAVCTWYVGGTHGPRRAGVPDRADLRARASHDRRALTSTRRRLNRRRCGGCDLEIADPEIAGISEIQPHFLVQICIECCRVNIAADSRYNLIENQVSN